MTTRPTRRAVLRGFGTALALPWFESIANAGAARPPLRLAYVYVPNGVHMPEWTPAEEGEGYELPPILEPLAPFRDRFSVLSGLTHDKGRANGDGPGDHARAAATFLTGVQPLKTDGQVRLGISADQVAATRIGAATRFRSIVLGCEGGRKSGQCDSGYACAYSHHISWQSETVPAAKEVDPRLVFDRLFRGSDDAEASAQAAERVARKKSVLDFVRADARRLRRRLGGDDRRKLDEYFSGLRELERRLDAALPARVDAVPDDARPDGVPDDHAEHARLMGELLALAFASDTTRVATFMIANEGSNRAYRSLGIQGGHHSISHHGRDPHKQGQIRDINRHHVSLLAHLIEKLASAREGAGDVLDSTLLVYGSGLADGNRHQHHGLPVLLFGGPAGGVRTGRHVRFPKETPMGDLHLALLERMGAGVPMLGDGRGPLTGL
ncbi:MAG: DUF1552 domain-containing protein [bacterium]|nr:DUF1552 domain-containing protein [bacterium]